MTVISPMHVWQSTLQNKVNKKNKPWKNKIFFHRLENIRAPGSAENSIYIQSKMAVYLTKSIQY